MEDSPQRPAFDYRATRDGQVRIAWGGKHVVTLSGKRAERFLRAVRGLDDAGLQLLMARSTGNFKRGNERPGRGPWK